jgi:hypothetical protein
MLWDSMARDAKELNIASLKNQAEGSSAYARALKLRRFYAKETRYSNHPEVDAQPLLNN